MSFHFLLFKNKRSGIANSNFGFWKKMEHFKLGFPFLIIDWSKSAGAKGDVQKICGFVHPLHPFYF